MRLCSALALVVLSAACTKTDVVAREVISGVRNDAGGDGNDAGDRPDSGTGLEDQPCVTRVCASFERGASRCGAGAASGPLLQVGDSCEDSVPRFRQALCSCSDFVTEHALQVTAPGGSSASVAIDGMLTSGAEVLVQGVLRVAGAYEVEPALVMAESTRLGEPSVCACGAGALPDVRAWIDAADPDLNRAGFDVAPLEHVTSDETQLLPCGNLVLDRIGGPSDLRLRVQGKVALFVRGDLSIDGGVQVALDDGAELDLIVGGNVRVVSAFDLGDESSVGRVRLYVGGDGTIDLGANAFVAGLFYAPRAELVTRGPVELRGPLFVERAAPGESVRIALPETAAQAVECAPAP